MNTLRRPAYCTTREAAKILGVSLRTAQVWSESGILEAWKTEGGHRRITRESIDRLLKDGRHQPVRSDGGGRRLQSRGATQGTGAVSAGAERLRLLVVEDDNVLLKLYRLRVAQWGLPIDLYTASNGYEGLILVGRELPDLMVIDLMIPGIDGFDLVRVVSNSAFREGMEIVVVTGLDGDEIAQRGGLPAGVHVHSKPVPFEALKETALSLLVRRTAL
jgi:excisionase family DNA binding protein